jgi:hypothetical protein
MAHHATPRRKAYRQRPVHANATLVAINAARKLSTADVGMQVAIMHTSLLHLQTGQDAAKHWRSMADAANVAETFAAMGLGAGAEADHVIDTAQRLLADIQLRHRARGTWALYASEIDALRWLISLHTQQLKACSYGEFERAITTTHNRLAQARAGNAPAGAIVITGDLA